MTEISIITPSFHAARTIASCLQSVARQTIPAEHILIDGGSADDTLEIARESGRHLSRIVSEEDRGIYDAMNKGLKMAGGDTIGFLNADDYYPSAGVLEKVREVFEDRSIESCYADLLYVDASHPEKVARSWRSGNYRPERFYWGWMPPHPTFFARKRVFERFGQFRLDLGTSADYELMLRFLLRHRVSTRYIPEVLVRMRTGGASGASLAKRLQANRYDRLAWELNGLSPYPWTIFLKPLRKVPQYFPVRHDRFDPWSGRTADRRQER